MPPPLPSRSEKSRRTTDSPISFYVQKALENPALISFAAGLVDEASLPAAEIGEAAAQLLADPVRARAALQYGSTQGLPALRKQVVEKVCAADGVAPGEVGLTPADVVITTGSQQLLYLLGEILFDAGDIVVTEAPSYFVYHSLLASHGVRVLTVPMDAGGMDVGALDRLLAGLKDRGELERVKVIYTVDYFQNPTGLTLAVERRPRLVEIARKYSTTHRILVLEDAAYRELRYDGDDIPSVKRFDSGNETVIYAGTFSKACAPGLKTGYALMPADVREPFLHLKGSHDFGSGHLAQHIASHLLASGAYARHVEELRVIYRGKRDAVLAALDREFGGLPGATWTVPTGGLFVWLTLEGVDTGPDGPLVSAAFEAGMMYVPGEYGYVSDEAGQRPTNACRLCFGVATLDQIDEGIRRLRRAVDAVAGRERKSKRVATGVG